MTDNPWSQPARWSSAWLLFVTLLSIGAGWSAAKVGQERAGDASSAAAPPAAQLATSMPADPLCAPAPAPSDPAAQAASREPPAPPAAPSDLGRAANGDLSALKTIELRPARERSVAESLALEAGHAALARLDAERLVQDLHAAPQLLRDRSTLGYAYRLALDPAAAPSLLAGLAAIEDPVAPDLLFDLVQRGEPGSRLVLLALDLLENAEVRRHASKALRVALDLRLARDCWQAAEVVLRAIDDGDARSLAPLERMSEERGCGPKKEDDCYACMRKAPYDERIAKAIDGVRSRPFKAPWRPADAPPR